MDGVARHVIEVLSKQSNMRLKLVLQIMESDILRVIAGWK